MKWTATNRSTLYFNTMACFTCTGKCEHYHLAEVNYRKRKLSTLEAEKPSTSKGLNFESICDNEGSLSEPDTSVTKAVTDNLKENNESFKEGEWVVLRFQLQQKRGERKWIGRILRKNENDTYLISFLRSTDTQLHSGYVYVYPHIRKTKPLCTKRKFYINSLHLKISSENYYFLFTKITYKLILSFDLFSFNLFVFCLFSFFVIYDIAPQNVCFRFLLLMTLLPPK